MSRRRPDASAGRGWDSAGGPAFRAADRPADLCDGASANDNVAILDLTVSSDEEEVPNGVNDAENTAAALRRRRHAAAAIARQGSLPARSTRSRQCSRSSGPEHASSQAALPRISPNGVIHLEESDDEGQAAAGNAGRNAAASRPTVCISILDSDGEGVGNAPAASSGEGAIASGYLPSRHAAASTARERITADSATDLAAADDRDVSKVANGARSADVPTWVLEATEWAKRHVRDMYARPPPDHIIRGLVAERCGPYESAFANGWHVCCIIGEVSDTQWQEIQARFPDPAIAGPSDLANTASNDHRAAGVRVSEKRKDPPASTNALRKIPRSIASASSLEARVNPPGDEDAARRLHVELNGQDAPRDAPAVPALVDWRGNVVVGAQGDEHGTEPSAGNPRADSEPSASPRDGLHAGWVDEDGEVHLPAVAWRAALPVAPVGDAELARRLQAEAALLPATLPTPPSSALGAQYQRDKAAFGRFRVEARSLPLYAETCTRGHDVVEHFIDIAGRTPPGEVVIVPTNLCPTPNHRGHASNGIGGWKKDRNLDVLKCPSVYNMVSLASALPMPVNGPYGSPIETLVPINQQEECPVKHPWEDCPWWKRAKAKLIAELLNLFGRYLLSVGAFPVVINLSGTGVKAHYLFDQLHEDAFALIVRDGPHVSNFTVHRPGYGRGAERGTVRAQTKRVTELMTNISDKIGAVYVLSGKRLPKSIIQVLSDDKDMRYVNVSPSPEDLRSQRAKARKQMIREIREKNNCSEDEAIIQLGDDGYEMALEAIMSERGCTAEAAKAQIDATSSFLDLLSNDEADSAMERGVRRDRHPIVCWLTADVLEHLRVKGFDIPAGPLDKAALRDVLARLTPDDILDIYLNVTALAKCPTKTVGPWSFTKTIGGNSSSVLAAINSESLTPLRSDSVLTHLWPSYSDNVPEWEDIETLGDAAVADLRAEATRLWRTGNAERFLVRNADGLVPLIVCESYHDKDTGLYSLGGDRNYPNVDDIRASGQTGVGVRNLAHSGRDSEVYALNVTSVSMWGEEAMARIAQDIADNRAERETMLANLKQRADEAGNHRCGKVPKKFVVFEHVADGEPPTPVHRFSRWEYAVRGSNRMIRGTYPSNYLGLANSGKICLKEGMVVEANRLRQNYPDDDGNPNEAFRHGWADVRPEEASGRWPCQGYHRYIQNVTNDEYKDEYGHLPED